jgi:antirestriction protein ArdC
MAFYMPSQDRVQMPPFADFKNAEGYYSVLYHELTHNAATGIMPHGLRWELVSEASAMRLAA